MKFYHIVLQACANYASIDGIGFFYTTSIVQDGGHGVISRKVLPSGECTRRVRPAHMQQRPPVSDP